MSLAASFPEDFVKQHFNEIDLGSAVLVEISDFNISHKKFAIYFANDVKNEGCCGLIIINSEINENVNRNAFLKSQHILIDVKRHKFLDYDSFVDCTQIHNHKLQDIIDCIVKNPKRLLGNIQPDILEKIYIKILHSKLISKKDKEKYSII
ncbi:hypothetical protein [Sphingobacterium sp. JUb56]|uniref:hypothetical protein n=1 Tax=Sphingobacterium sp. JUb56 TaxID=2587145 RepID=UPI00160C4D4D|nr:hypothetical protein [Sphingobacterium sp. JUb56]MBB2951967.1 hypothetical protein [Sphingobacterium sp. JUb56]